MASLRIAAYHQQVAKYYNKNIQARTFKAGDWVLHRVFQNTKDLGAGKLGLTWEGPYKISKVVGYLDPPYILITTRGNTALFELFLFVSYQMSTDLGVGGSMALPPTTLTYAL